MFNCSQCGKCCRYVSKHPYMKELDRGDGACIFLTNDNKCEVYEDRPLTCNIDKMYETFLKDKMTKEEWYELNYKYCKEL